MIVGRTDQVAVLVPITTTTYGNQIDIIDITNGSLPENPSFFKPHAFITLNITCNIVQNRQCTFTNAADIQALQNTIAAMV